MPNTTAIPELIALEIVSRLGEISVENGYAFDVSEVVRPNRNGDNWNKKDHSIGVMQGPQERQTDLDFPGNPPAIAYQTTYSIICVLRDSIESSALGENEAAAAIVQAIVGDSTMWYTMNSNAIDSTFGDFTPFAPGDGEMNGIVVPVTVTYRVSETNPFAVRA